MTTLAIAQAAARRIARDRTALFFMVVLPVVVIIVVGAVVSGVDRFRIGLVVEDRGSLATELVADLHRNDALEIHRFASLEVARTALRRSEIAALVLIPRGTDTGLRQGREVEVPVYGENVSSSLQAASAAVASTVATQGARVQAAHFAAKEVGGGFAQNYERASAAARTTSVVGVENVVVDTKSHFLPKGFSYSAPTMLVLFVFINALAAGAAMIETRKLGMYERMNAAPVTPDRIVLGETIVYFSIALAQSILIVAVGLFLFGVDWGNAAGAAALVAVWALVGTGAGMLVGTVFRTPEQATSISPAVGMVLGMLGGCMWPLEIVPSGMRAFGHLTPQAWAVDAWTELMSRGGTLMSIGRELAVLGGFAVVLLGVASVRLRRALTR